MLPSPHRKLTACLVALIGALALSGVVALADGTGLAGTGVAARPAPAADTSATVPPAPTTTTVAPSVPSTTTTPPPTAPPVPVPTSTLLAAPQGTIPTSAVPGGPPTGTTGVWYGYELVLPVIAQQAGWSEVRLPQRPNESTAWVADSSVTFSQTPYYLRVSLSAMHLTVYRAGQPIMSFPVGVGTPATPTVTGNYFVAVHQPGPDPVLGPVVLDLSAHSDALQTFDGGNDAIIAIHGPVGAEAQIGTTGARVSNGCVRLPSNADDAQMAEVPVGAPVDILP